MGKESLTHFPITPWLKFLLVRSLVIEAAADQSRRHLAGGARDRIALLVNLHAQREPHGSKDFLDFIERLASEVFGLEHLVFRLLLEIKNGLNIVVLQAVVTADGKLQLFHRAVEIFVYNLRFFVAASVCLQLFFTVDEA